RRLLSEQDIDYIKWDMNRYMTEVFSLTQASQHQGEIFHRYILNVYRLYEQLTTEFPHILFESCSSGGARFDPGMLH
ncbi:alpha-galactosidase, partial [Streptococcus pyogenes]